MINTAEVQAIKDIGLEVKDADLAKTIDSLDKAIKDVLKKAREAQAKANADRVNKEATPTKAAKTIALPITE